MRVALIEKRSICSGASGRNGGQVIQVEGRDELTKDMITKKNSIASHGKKLLDTLSDELGTDIEYRKTGGLDLAYSDEDENVIRMVTKRQHEVGDTGVEYLGASGVRDICPVLGEGLRGGKHRADDGNANPFRITYGYALGARKYGAQVFTYTTVRSVIHEKGKAAGVSTDRGDFAARHGVVNAANAWTRYVFPDYPVVPCKVLAFATEQFPQIPMPPTKTLIFDRKGDPGYSEENNQAYLFYGGSQKDGNIIIGGPPSIFPTTWTTTSTKTSPTTTS